VYFGMIDKIKLLQEGTSSIAFSGMGRKTNVMDLQHFMFSESQLELYKCILYLKLCEIHCFVL